jgi:hypothetical protein
MPPGDAAVVPALGDQPVKARLKRKGGELRPAGAPPDKKTKAKMAWQEEGAPLPPLSQGTSGPSRKTVRRHARRARANARRRLEEGQGPPAPRDPRTYLLAPHVVAHHPAARVERLNFDAEDAIAVASTAWEAVQLRYARPSLPFQPAAWHGKAIPAFAGKTWTLAMALAAGCRVVRWDGR